MRSRGGLGGLACGRELVRATDDEIILFKSVGMALEDLAASKLVVAAAFRAKPP